MSNRIGHLPLVFETIGEPRHTWIDPTTDHAMVFLEPLSTPINKLDRTEVAALLGIENPNKYSLEAMWRDATIKMVGAYMREARNIEEAARRVKSGVGQTQPLPLLQARVG